MTGRGSKQKGSSFELQIAKMIVDAFREFGVKDEDCYRTPASGGHRFVLKKDPGDLWMSPNLQKLLGFGVVECKSRKRLEWRQIFKPLTKNGKHGDSFFEWWHQVCMAASGISNKLNMSQSYTEPLLVFKENRSQVLAMMCPDGAGPFCGLITTVGTRRLFVCDFQELLMVRVFQERDRRGRSEK